MQHQDELPLSSIKAHVLFPGRTSLYPHEVAKALSMTTAAVIDLCEEGAIEAVNIAGKNNKSDRKFWRIPVSGYDKYTRENSNQNK